KLGAQGFCKGLNHSDTDPLLFGKPITLQVDPKDNTEKSSPELSILSSNGGDETCLAAGFFPKAGTLSLFTEKETLNYTVDRGAVLSTQNKYYFAAFSKEKIQTCKMNERTAVKTVEQSTATAANCEGSNAVTSIKTDTHNISSEILKPETKSYSGDPKGNTMQLIVTGLRLMLAKAVGVNILMTFKAFLV
ncbi:hypothetical protein QTP86_025342, partial [Hemibagrus guttatus]